MKISWLGHASFLIESGGKYLITDPCDEQCGYQPWNQPVDIATVSHDHYDHNAVEHLRIPLLSRGRIAPLQKGFTVQGFRSYHDRNQASNGINYIYKSTTENIDILHLGDQGTLLDQDL